MPKAQRFHVEGKEQEDLPILARVKANGSYITSEVVSAITWTAKRSDGLIATSGANAGSFSVDSVVMDMLTVDDRWTEDAQGYNFIGVIPASALCGPGSWEIEIKITLFSGGFFYIPVTASLLSLFSV